MVAKRGDRDKAGTTPKCKYWLRIGNLHDAEEIPGDGPG